MAETETPDAGKPTLTIGGKPVDLTAPQVRLDLMTPLEIGLLVLAIFAGVTFLSLAPVAFFTPDFPVWGAAIPLVLTLLAVWLYRNVDCTYLLDNEEKRIEYRRTVLGSTTRIPVGRFDDVAAVTVKGTYQKSKYGAWWLYRVCLVLQDGKVFDVSDGERDDLDGPNAGAAALARQIGVPCVPGAWQMTLKVTPGEFGKPPDIGMVPWDSWAQVKLVLIVTFATFFFIVAGVLAAVALTQR